LHGTGLSIADVDAGSATVEATVSVASGTISAGAGTTGVTVAGSGTSTVTLTGTLTQINNLLAGSIGGTLTYTINSDTPPATDTLTLQASDLGNTGTGGTLTGSDTATINITAVNDAPVNTVPGAQATAEDTPLTFSSGNGNQITIGDVDAAANTVQVTLTATNGVLTLAGLTGLSFSVGDGAADATMTFTGSIVDINSALNGLSYAPTNDFNGAAQLQITTNDLGNVGIGGPLTDTDVVAITVTAVNDAPTIIAPAPQSAAFQQSTTFSAAGGNAIVVADVDAGSSLVRLTLTVTNGTLSLAQIVGLTFISGDGTADSTIIVDGVIADLNAALDGLVFTPASTFRGTATVGVALDDQGNTGSGGAQQAAAQTTVDIAPAAQRITFAGPSLVDADNFVATFSSSQGAALTFTDVYDENPTLTVSLVASHGTFQLARTAGLTFLTGAFSGTSMSFTGSLADVNAALDGAIFTSDASDATLTIQGQDAPRDGGGSHSITSLIDVYQPPIFPGVSPAPISEQLETILEEIEQLLGVTDLMPPVPTLAVERAPPPALRPDLTAGGEFVAPVSEWKVFESIAVRIDFQEPELTTTDAEYAGLKPPTVDRGKNGLPQGRASGLDSSVPWQRITIVTKNDSSSTFNQDLVAGTAGVAATLSVGYVLWSIRAASLLSTFLASMPAWQAFDPLPVIDCANRRFDDEPDDFDDADEATQNLFATTTTAT
jgi:hypothetical protein